MSAHKKRSPAGTYVTDQSAAPTTASVTTRQAPRTTLFGHCRYRAATKLVVTQHLMLRPNASLQLALLATGMQCCNTAAQIFKLNFSKTCCAQHSGKRLLIRKPGNRIRQIFVGAARAAQPAANPRQQVPVIQLDEFVNTGNDGFRKLQDEQPSLRLQHPF